MKRLLMISFLFQAFIASADEPKGIPSDSMDLLAKLQQFERAEHEKVDAIIREKRRAVAVVLEQHLVRETRAGNLDAALQLRNAISNLTKRKTIAGT